MSKENSISIVIPPADLQAVRDALATANSILLPFLIALTPEQRKKMLKVGDGTEPFVDKVMDYAVTDPQFLPAYVQLAEMQKDYDAVEGLLPIFRTVQQLESKLNDTVMLVGSEVYQYSLSYYNSVKMGTKMNSPNAKPIYEDLKKRFEKKPKKKIADTL